MRPPTAIKTTRIFLAGLFHETNTFAPGTTGLDAFALWEDQALLARAGDGSQVGAFLEDAARRQWTVLPSLFMLASPGPTVRTDAVDFFRTRLKADLQSALREGVEGVFLILHGAMVSEQETDVEGLVLAEIATLLEGRKIPVAVVLDPHANVTPRMARHANILLPCRENPHTDAAEAALRTAELLARCLEAAPFLETTFVSTPVVWPPAGTGSADQPVKNLLALAQTFERADIPAVNVFPGFAHADTPQTGVSFSIVHDPSRTSAGEVSRISHALRQAAVDNAPLGLPAEWKLDQAIQAAREKACWPCLLVEPSDNIGGGGPGDSTWVLRALLEHHAAKSGVILHDPRAVAALETACLGDEIQIPVGGWSGPLSGPPVKLEARVVNKTDGHFEVEDSRSHIVAARGRHIHMGPCVLLESEGITILLTSRKTPPFDLGQWRGMGVQPEQFQFIGIKAAVAHRQAYDRICRQSFTVCTPGCGTSDLPSLSFRHLRRPVFPLDPLPLNP